MTKFTPEPLSAPWMYHEAITHDGRATGEYQIALNSEKTYPVATVYTKPAARLIAAAPDLLEALQTVANDCQMILDGDDMSGMSDAEIFGAIYNTVNAAVAKATED